jgi:hypothetical protein
MVLALAWVPTTAAPVPNVSANATVAILVLSLIVQFSSFF